MEFGHQFSGLEFHWLAVDSEGLIGCLCTAGFGPLPGSVLANAASFEHAFERAMTLVEICAAIPNHSFPGVTYYWEKMAKRGLFAYDWRDEIGCYQIVATPRIARRLETVEDHQLADLARLTVLPLNFRESERIEPTVVP